MSGNFIHIPLMDLLIVVALISYYCLDFLVVSYYIKCDFFLMSVDGWVH